MIRTPFYLFNGITLLEPPVWISEVKRATNIPDTHDIDDAWELQIGTRAGIITLYWGSSTYLGGLRANLINSEGSPAVVAY
jgi:hypothetical protein